jgi:hypothetical protein
MSMSAKLDLMVLCVLFVVICIVMYIEYDVNVVLWLFNFVKETLDPGYPPEAPAPVSLDTLSSSTPPSS